MAIYCFKCDECGQEFEQFTQKNDTFDAQNSIMWEKCPNREKNPIEPSTHPLLARKSPCPLVQIPTVPGRIEMDPFKMGRAKPNQDFRNRLDQIRKAHPGSTIQS